MSMSVIALHRRVTEAGGEFRINHGRLQYRYVPERYMDEVIEFEHELLRYCALLRKHGASCRQCGALPLERLSDGGLCWRCVLNSIGHAVQVQKEN